MEYQGEDLIIVAGAPGSRWSGAIRMLSLLCRDINLSDNKNDFVYRKKVNGEVVGWHRGAYWGPDNPVGHKFDLLQHLTKEEIVKEFKAPFANWDHGIKIIKSHWFSYHIPLLKELFPKATIWAFHDTPEECVKWWKHVGGWNIDYPMYTWYENDEKMLQQVKIECAEIKKHFKLKRYSGWKETAIALGFTYNIRTIEEIIEVDPEFSELHQYDTEEVFNAFLDRMFTRKEMGIIFPTA